MSDTIERLLAVEQQAKRILAQAQREASETVDRARAEAQRLIIEARERARAEANQVLRRREAEAEKDREAALRQAAEGSPGIGEVDEESFRSAVDRIVKVIAWGEADQGQ